MSCNDCLAVLEEFVEDGLDRQTSEQLAAHVAVCQPCRIAFEELESEREIYSRYLLKIKERPESWNAVLAGIRERKTGASNTPNVGPTFYERFSALFFRKPLYAAMAVLVLLLGIALFYRTYSRREPDLVSSPVRRNEPVEERKTNPAPAHPLATDSSLNPANDGSRLVKENRWPRYPNERAKKLNAVKNEVDMSVNSFDSSEAAFNRHLEKCEMVLRSFRNAVPETNEPGFDVSYEKRLSNELVKNSARFRRASERQSNPQVDELLISLESLLGDIARLRAKPTLSDASVIKGRIHESGIVARLQVRSLLARAGD